MEYSNAIEILYSFRYNDDANQPYRQLSLTKIDTEATIDTLKYESERNIHTPGRRQSKTLILSTNVDQKSLEAEFLIVICRLIGDKWQSKTLFLAIYDPSWSIVWSVFDCRLPGVVQQMCDFRVYDKRGQL